MNIQDLKNALEQDTPEAYAESVEIVSKARSSAKKSIDLANKEVSKSRLLTPEEAVASIAKRFGRSLAIIAD